MRTKRLVAYLVPDRLLGLFLVDDVRQKLAPSLAAYMMPARFVTVDALPLTPAGKIDRRGLAAFSISTERPDLGIPFVAPPYRGFEAMLTQHLGRGTRTR